MQESILNEILSIPEFLELQDVSEVRALLQKSEVDENLTRAMLSSLTMIISTLRERIKKHPEEAAYIFAMIKILFEHNVRHEKVTAYLNRLPSNNEVTANALCMLAELLYSPMTYMQGLSKIFSVPPFDQCSVDQDSVRTLFQLIFSINDYFTKKKYDVTIKQIERAKTTLERKDSSQTNQGWQDNTRFKNSLTRNLFRHCTIVDPDTGVKHSIELFFRKLLDDMQASLENVRNSQVELLDSINSLEESINEELDKFKENAVLRESNRNQIRERHEEIIGEATKRHRVLIKKINNPDLAELLENSLNAFIQHVHRSTRIYNECSDMISHFANNNPLPDSLKSFRDNVKQVVEQYINVLKESEQEYNNNIPQLRSIIAFIDQDENDLNQNTTSPKNNAESKFPTAQVVTETMKVTTATLGEQAGSDRSNDRKHSKNNASSEFYSSDRGNTLFVQAASEQDRKLKQEEDIHKDGYVEDYDSDCSIYSS